MGANLKGGKRMPNDHFGLVGKCQSINSHSSIHILSLVLATEGYCVHLFTSKATSQFSFDGLLSSNTSPRPLHRSYPHAMIKSEPVKLLVIVHAYYPSLGTVLIETWLSISLMP